jgi:ankyrin repeat protein
LTSDRLRTSEVVNLRQYHIPLDSAHYILARACLTVLLQLDEKVDKKRLATFPLAFYAAQHWFVHAKHEGVSPRVQDAMEQLFNPSKPHLAAWVWIHDVDQGRFRRSIDSLDDHPSPPEATALYYAAICGLRGPAKYLISTHGEDINSKCGDHGSLLHAASWNGHLDAVSLLLDHGADVNMSNENKQTPLCAAYRGDCLNVMQLLLERGAAPDVYYDGWGLLTHDASYKGRAEVIRLLLQHNADVNAIGGANLTPLHWASQEGEVDAAQILLEHGADVNAVSDYGTPLYYASLYERLEVVRLLLEHGADVHIRAPGRETPFHVASERGHTEVAQLLLEHGADKE